MNQTNVADKKALGSEESPAEESLLGSADQVSSPQIELQSLPNGRWSFVAAIWRTIPTLGVVAALAGLGYWGHRTGWKLPKFSALTGIGHVHPADWCGEHGVPETQCVECRPDRMPKTKTFGWCKQHGVHDCPIEHPEVTQLKTPPEVTDAELERAQRALDFAERPENNSKCKLQLRRIQYASREDVEKAGVEVAPVWEAPITEAVSANGETAYDQTRVARLSTRVAGIVWRVDKVVGDRVTKGEVLALVDAAEVGRAKAELLQSLALVELKAKTMARIRPLADKAIKTQAELLEAEAALKEARIRAHNAEQILINLGLPVRVEDVRDLPEDQLIERVRLLGLPETVTDSLDRQTTANLLPLTAPFDGVVVSREAVAGEVVEAAKTLLVVADVSRLWLMLDVRLEDAKYLAPGQPVQFHSDGDKGMVSGNVTWLSTAVDEKVRTVKVRADLDNADGRLRASTFGAGRIVLREEPKAVVVPNEAVHWEGCCHIVFVRDKNFLEENAPKVFHVRKVRLGAKDEQYREVIAGVLPGEVVAARGSGVLRAQLLKNNLGAG